MELNKISLNLGQYYTINLTFVKVVLLQNLKKWRLRLFFLDSETCLDYMSDMIQISRIATQNYPLHVTQGGKDQQYVSIVTPLKC